MWDAVELEGVVEYKSLPSGLHKVKEDLMYTSCPSQLVSSAKRHQQILRP